MLLKSVKNYASKMYSDWTKKDTEAVLSLVEDKVDSLIDLGCGDGRITKIVAKKTKAKEVLGLDSNPIKCGIKIVKGDLNGKFPFKNNSFDLALSHYSIEHLYNTGLFISETYRILKKGGYTIVATDNLSNWPNIFALLLGFQPFPMTDGICKRSVGNPFSIRANFDEVVSDKKTDLDWRTSGEWSHNKVLSYGALVDAYKEFGFEIERIIGVGYFPFGGWFSKFLANIDKKHAQFLIIKARKK
jgi:SAM-dependent methyltransferase